MSVHGFADESKHQGYRLAVAVLAAQRLTAARRDMRALRLSGQRRVHFTKERPARRAAIVQAICELDLEVWIYDASAHNDHRTARTRCLQRVIADLAANGGQRLVIEQDDSLIAADRKDLWAAVRQAQKTVTLAYQHLPPSAEPLLWIADAAAWCWAHDSTWRSRIDPVVTRVRTV
jgi:hypothetical protein